MTAFACLRAGAWLRSTLLVAALACGGAAFGFAGDEAVPASSAPAGLTAVSPDRVDMLYRDVARGGDVLLSPGLYVLPRTLVLPARTRVRGAGRGVTVLRLAPGANVNLVETAGFAELSGSAQLAQAPSDVTLVDMTLDGGFLDGKWTDPKRRVLNTQGSCLAVYGRRMTIDVEASNCPQHMLYAEGQGPRGSEEVSSRFRLDGLVAGEECVVYRGVGDSQLEHLGAGVCGAKRMQPALKEQRSRWYPEEPGFDGLVVERQAPYEGTLEVGFAHVFGTFSGWGVRTRGNPRFHAQHLISESNLGGVLIDKGTWGTISMLDVHSNGKSMGVAPGAAPAPREGLRVDSSVGFSVAHGTLFRSVGSVEGSAAALIAGQGGQFNLVVLNSRNPQTGQDHAGDAVVVTGRHNVLTVTAQRTRGEPLQLGGADNLAVFSGEGTPKDTGERNTLVSGGGMSFSTSSSRR